MEDYTRETIPRRLTGQVSLRIDCIDLLPNPDSAITNHLITLSDIASIFGGITRPICLAVFKLTVKINLVGFSIGSSAGFAPFRILSTKMAARRYESVRSAPNDIRPPASTNSFVGYIAGSRLSDASSTMRAR